MTYDPKQLHTLTLFRHHPILIPKHLLNRHMRAENKAYFCLYIFISKPDHIHLISNHWQFFEWKACMIHWAFHLLERDEFHYRIFCWDREYKSTFLDFIFTYFLGHFWLRRTRQGQCKKAKYASFLKAYLITKLSDFIL